MNLSSPVDVLARTLFGEASGEGRAGMAAVASVILARARNGRWWGHDISSVCLTPWQFSCWQWPPAGNRAKLLAITAADPYFRLALAVATQAVAGDLVDATNGADSYANLSLCTPVWIRGLTPCAVIGRHTFFRTELAAPAVAPLNSADTLNQAELEKHR